ncbi:oxidoreductase [Lacibacterium aquatile]|uniref:Oxidoreductase n=1 Tax=Lacibacterium aquatile TaxID=1168082 RepID=A0ABW5DZI2_9PROT
MSEPLNVALVGYGFVGKTTHAPLIEAVPGLNLHTIVSSKGAAVTQERPGVRVVADLAEALDDAIDLVVIATPNDLHAPQAHAALDAGKHVVVDKPFTLSLAEAQAVMGHGQRAGKLVSVFQNRRLDSDFMTLRHLVQTGKLGAVAEFHSHYDRWRPTVRDRWREHAGPGTGIWVDLGAHLADQALQLFGVPDAVYGEISNRRPGSVTTDYFHMLLRYQEVRVILHGSSLAQANGLRYIAHGSKASYVKYGIDAQEDMLKAGQKPGDEGWGDDPIPGELIVSENDWPQVIDRPVVRGEYRAYYAAMRDAILGKGPPPVTPREALDLMKLLDLGIASSNARRELLWNEVP